MVLHGPLRDGLPQRATSNYPLQWLMQHAPAFAALPPCCIRRRHTPRILATPISGRTRALVARHGPPYCRNWATGQMRTTRFGAKRLSRDLRPAQSWAGAGRGHVMVHRGFQATAMLGLPSGAAACSVIAGLDVVRIVMALSIAGCQTAGLSIAAGTMMKPFNGGKTAFDAVIASALAADGFAADPALFKKGGGDIGSKRIGGLARAFVQDGFAEFAFPDFAAGWEILRN
jgi:hypothetical protein